ncbi:MAG: hypothetical protein ABEJ57_00720 [Halobacteriaceae archaeon]
MHELNEWRNREGDLVGASVFLTPEDVEEVREEGRVVIEICD